MDTARSGVLVTTDIPTTQFILDLNEKTKKEFVIEQLDETHLFVDALFVDFIKAKLHQHMEEVVFTPRRSAAPRRGIPPNDNTPSAPTRRTRGRGGRRRRSGTLQGCRPRIIAASRLTALRARLAQAPLAQRTRIRTTPAGGATAPALVVIVIGTLDT